MNNQFSNTILQYALIIIIIIMPLSSYGLRLDFSFHAENGGFVKIENKESGLTETHFYTGSTITHAFQVSACPVLLLSCFVLCSFVCLVLGFFVLFCFRFFVFCFVLFMHIRFFSFQNYQSPKPV